MASYGMSRIYVGLLLTALLFGCSGPSTKIKTTITPTRPMIVYSNLPAASTISTLAGGGVGDGGLAVEASLYTPQAVAVDSEGNIFICDTGHNRIRRVDAKTGIITTVVGTGIKGNDGDHGRALKAQIESPHGVHFGPKGFLYISDTGNQRLRMLDKRGNLHPSIGKKPDVGPSVMPEDHDHSLMFADSGGSGEDITLAPPHHITLDDNGNIFISEMENNRVIKIDKATKELIVIAGMVTNPGFGGDGELASEASLQSPHSVAVDKSGNVYIADTLNSRIRKVDSETGIITTIAGTGVVGFVGDEGLASRAHLAGPSGIAVSPDGNVYVVDTDNRRIRKLTPFESEWRITTVAGNGQRGRSGDGGLALNASFIRPVGIDIDSEGNLYIADTGAHLIRKIDTSGIITTVAGNGRCCYSGDGKSATSAEFMPPYGISMDSVGRLFIVDRDNHRIRRVDLANGIITTVAGNGSRRYRGDGLDALEASLYAPRDVAISQDGSFFIADQGNHRIRKVDGITGRISTVAGSRSPGFSGDGGLATRARLDSPGGVAIDKKGNFYISDTGNQRIRMVESETGLIRTVVGNGNYGFSGDGGAAIDAAMGNPTNLTLDPEGNLYISDTENHRIRKVDMKTGIITTVAGSGKTKLMGDGGPALQASLRYPSGIAIHNDLLYISDTGHHLVRVVSLKTGLIFSLTGRGWPGLRGDGGPAEKAALNSPHGIFIHSNTLYIADTDNRRIRFLDLSSEQHEDHHEDSHEIKPSKEHKDH